MAGNDLLGHGSEKVGQISFKTNAIFSILKENRTKQIPMLTLFQLQNEIWPKFKVLDQHSAFENPVLRALQESSFCERWPVGDYITP